MAKYKITYSAKFKKDFKKYQKRPRELKAIIEILEQLRQGAEAIPKRMKPHINEIHLIRVGSHSELF